MSHRPPDTTNGFLPASAFRHLGPTAVRKLDLEMPLRIRSPDGAQQPIGERDALVLVRLHQDPVAILHVSDGLDALSEAELLDRVWREGSHAVRAHVRGHGCAAEPNSREDLRRLLMEGSRAEEGPVAQRRQSVAVIIPTGGRVDQLRRCLESLRALDSTPSDVLIVDNRPDRPETRELLAGGSFGIPVRYVAEHRPGSSVARNRGIAETDAQILAFTDDDVIVDPGWLDYLVAPFSDGEVEAVTGMVLPLELETRAQKLFEQYAGFSKGLDRRVYDMHAHRADDRVLYPFWGGVFGSGNSMAFRRDSLVAAGGFDPALGAGSLALAGADIDAMSSAVLRGKLVYEPRALVWHEHRRAEDALRRQLFNYGAGLTAIFTKRSLTDLRFASSVARSMPLVGRRLAARAAEETGAVTLPGEYAALERRGMLRGPALYFKSRRWAKRLGLDEVILGR